MKQLKKFNIDESASQGITLEEIKLFLCQNSDGFLFQKVIERVRQYSDFVINYLEASYVCEQIAVFGKVESFEVDWKSGYHPVAQFKIMPKKLEELQELLYEISQA